MIYGFHINYLKYPCSIISLFDVSYETIYEISKIIIWYYLPSIIVVYMLLSLEPHYFIKQVYRKIVAFERYIWRNGRYFPWDWFFMAEDQAMGEVSDVPVFPDFHWLYTCLLCHSECSFYRLEHPINLLKNSISNICSSFEIFLKLLFKVRLKCEFCW